MTPAARFWAKVRVGAPDECWPWTRCRTKTGYGVTAVANRTVTAHRAAYIFTHGKTDAQHICHSCDNPACCNPAHLWAGTALANSRDKIAKGRAPTTCLTEEQARRVKFGSENGADLAREFGVSRTTISQIRTGKTFAWLAA